MNPPTANLSPNQKSAILLMSVSPELAAETLKLRSAQEVAAITYEINYTRLSKAVQAQVLSECLGNWTNPSVTEVSGSHSTTGVTIEQPPPNQPDTKPVEAQKRVDFDDLLHCQRDSLANILRFVEFDDMAMALKGASRALSKRIYDCLPPEQSEELRQAVEQIGQAPWSEVKQAQLQIAQTFQGLVALGKVRFSS